MSEFFFLGGGLYRARVTSKKNRFDITRRTNPRIHYVPSSSSDEYKSCGDKARFNAFTPSRAVVVSAPRSASHDMAAEAAGPAKHVREEVAKPKDARGTEEVFEAREEAATAREAKIVTLVRSILQGAG